MSDLAARWLPLLLDASLKSLVVFAAAGVALLFLRRASAATRHLVWLLALLGVLLLPLLSSALPDWRVSIWPRATSAWQAAPEDAPPSASPDTLPRPAPAATPPAASAEPPSPEATIDASPTRRIESLPWPTWVFGLWLAGAVIVLGQVAAGLVHVWCIGRRSRPVTDGPLAELAAHGAREMGMQRKVTLRIGGKHSPSLVPMTWGWLRPVVLLPRDAGQWPEERLRVVLLHELAHARRGDWLAQMLAHVACALHWPHPLVWLAAFRLRAEMERACDDRVLAAGVEASDYARHLLDIARSLRTTSSTPRSAATIARTSQIEGRLRAILAASRSRRAVTPRAIQVALAALVGLLVPLACMRPAETIRSRTQAPVNQNEGNAPVEWKEPLPGNVVPASGWTGTVRGVTVEVAGVSSNPSDPRRTRTWWKPDGAPLAEPPYHFSRLVQGLEGEGMRDKKVREVAIKLMNPSAIPIDVRYQFAESGSGSLLIPINRNGREIAGTRAIVEGFPNAQDRATLLVGIAAGPWETNMQRAFRKGSGSAAERFASESTTGDGKAILSLIDVAGGQTVVSVTDNLVDRDHRLVTVDINGDLVVGERRDGSTTKTTGFRTQSLDDALRSYSRMRQTLYVFPRLPSRRIKEIRFQTRPYQWLEFRDIALEPAERSEALATPRPTAHAQVTAQTPARNKIRVFTHGDQQNSRDRIRVFTVRYRVPGDIATHRIRIDVTDKDGQLRRLKRPQWSIMGHL